MVNRILVSFTGSFLLEVAFYRLTALASRVKAKLAGSCDGVTEQRNEFFIDFSVSRKNDHLMTHVREMTLSKQRAVISVQSRQWGIYDDR
ncbi:MAG: hypothetical protein WA708_13970 [Acidobacteriaceae bacterium]